VRTVARCISSLAVLAAGPVSTSALCPKSAAGEILVCADPNPPPSRYRLPQPPPPAVGSAASISVGRERNGLFAYDAGGSGLCSSVGPGGAYGCLAKQHKAMTEQRANARDPSGRIYDAAKPR